MTSEPAAPPRDRLLHEALTKSGVLWLGGDRRTARAAWFAYVEPYVLLVTGPGEQTLPPLGEETTLVLRAKDSRAGLLQVPAQVEQILPTDERWPELTAALAGARLNADALPADLPARWATDATVLALTPDPARAQTSPPDDSAERAVPRPLDPAAAPTDAEPPAG